MIVPVILCGGVGLRLWPWSREDNPKQFLNIINKELNLFQETILRCNNRDYFYPPIIITNESYLSKVKFFLAEINVQPSAILVEPLKRNTALPINISALYISQKFGSDTKMLILPCDHHINNNKYFLSKVIEGINIVNDSYLACFGINPEYPSTNFGYIEKREAINDSAYKVKQFHEKPDQKKAENYIKSGNYFWNSGIFFVKADLLLEEFGLYQREIFKTAVCALENAVEEKNCYYLCPYSFYEANPISFDYAIMEKTKKAAILPYENHWSDLGSWDSIYDLSPKDENNNIIKGNVLSENISNCYIESNSDLLTVAANLTNLHINIYDDLVLIADKTDGLLFEKIALKLKKLDKQEYKTSTVNERPWGNFKKLEAKPGYKVKLITVYPNKKISLQIHRYRSEFWYILEGKAEVINGEELVILSQYESLSIPRARVHSIKNISHENLVILEVQLGNYLEENDIIRLEEYDKFQYEAFQAS